MSSSLVPSPKPAEDGVSRPPPDIPQKMHVSIAAHKKVHNHKGSPNSERKGDRCKSTFLIISQLLPKGEGLLGKIKDMLEGNPDPE